MSHIFLVGFMGSGKTTIGRNLSKELDLPLFDTDEMIIKKDGRQISRIFKESGEGYFRRLENMILREMPTDEDYVVSCGGGMATRKENVDIMKEKGRVVYLFASPQTILRRVEKSDKRPILEGNKNIEFITDLMNKRVSFYENAADLTVDVNEGTPLEIAHNIITSLT